MCLPSSCPGGWKTVTPSPGDGNARRSAPSAIDSCAVEVQRIGVVGLGAMGAGIAQVAVEAGFDVVGREVTAELGEEAAGRIGHFLTRKVEKGQETVEQRDAAVARLQTTTELAALQECDLVIEAIVEAIGPKRALFAELESI